MKRHAPFCLPFGFAALGLVMAALVLAPQAAVAQHGGGHAGGGGGHFGGGGGHFAGFGFGGGHSRSSSHQAPSPASARHPAESTPLPADAKPLASSAVATNEFAPFGPTPVHTTIGFPPPEQPTTFPAALVRSEQSARPLSFSGEGHQIWQNFAEPSSPAVNHFNPQLMHPQPPHIIRPPILFTPYPVGSPWTFGFYGSGPFLGFGWGCGPYVWFGCGGFGYGTGYGYGYGYGYGLGGYYPPAWDYDQPPASDDSSNEPSPSTWQNPPTGEDFENNVSVSTPGTLIYLQDGTSYEVTDYWLADNTLHYVTNYGGENSVRLNQIDVQRTVDVNAARGVDFTLHPAPPAPLTPPPSADSEPPAKQQP